MIRRFYFTVRNGQFLAGLLAMAVFSGACSPRAPAESFPAAGRHATTLQQGIAVPVFSSAARQLALAYSWSDDPAKKRAAFQAVLALFPGDRAALGSAQLELAYALLDPDYRTAGRRAYLAAAAEYNRIALEFEDVPAVSVKARWYLGWVHTDLLKDSKTGMMHYARVVSDHADQVLQIAPPVPWVSLVYDNPVARQPADYVKPAYHWAGIALLEMVKHLPHHRDRLRAARTLLFEYRDSLATARALRELLQQAPHDEAVKALAQRYLQTTTARHHPAGDIEALLRPDSQRPNFSDRTGPVK